MMNTEWIQRAAQKGLGFQTSRGTLLVDTGKYTGRAVKERFVADHPEIHDSISWSGANQPLEAGKASHFLSALEKRLREVNAPNWTGFVGPYPIEVYSTSDWHLAFANNMFRKTPPPSVKLPAADLKPIRIFHDPDITSSKLTSGMPSETLIVLDPSTRTVGIVGTAYAGEIKKSAFALCNYLLPMHGILSMHSSANCKQDGSNACVLFGLSGTGKTTLSASPDRHLIGDDEIVWSDAGLSNLEGGCYAKLIDLTEDQEPEIFRAVHQPGAILENVVFDPKTEAVKFSDRTRTENTRGSYPLTALSKVFDQTAEAKHPETIVFLTADAFGAMPAVAKLNSFQTQFYFLSGYTAKVAGTELGVKEPQATFSTCFGAPFMPRHAPIYASLLAKKVQAAGAKVWLLNTGWQPGGFGKAERYPIKVSRKILEAIQNGTLESQPRVTHPVFGFEVPTACPQVDPAFLKIPEGDAVTKLAQKFRDNMETFRAKVDPEVLTKGAPRV